MDDRSKETPEAAAERIAKPLRTHETLPMGFEQRVLSALRRQLVEGAPDERPVGFSRWWITPRSLRLAPLASAALAAGFALIVALSTLLAAGSLRSSPTPVVAAHTDTVHVVRFVFLDSTAKQVAVVGDFNDWERAATPLVSQTGSGMWTASVVLRPGHHEYAFIVDGKRWAPDPFALTKTDEFGTTSSIMTVGATGDATD
jgi:hypothetical protein